MYSIWYHELTSTGQLPMGTGPSSVSWTECQPAQSYAPSLKMLIAWMQVPQCCCRAECLALQIACYCAALPAIGGT